MSEIITNFKTTNWLGGTTTELFIYPEGSNLKALDFDFRLSTATIEIEESDFTPLPSVHRTLLLLDGDLKLIHKNHHASSLKPLEHDVFEGDWETKSIGEAKPFNLFTRGNTSGKLEAIQLSKGSSMNIENKANFTFLYLYKGEIQIENTNESENSLLQIDTNTDLLALLDSTLVKVEIS